ncbi:hypothetical protein SLEP1_g52055 [Rubroshorea leprosula]|uniref:Uncharacterized protein n=1 Tax=Rubroshorea leprosula TaxID=152421 RepID=A0AAV5M8T9_9ROSI|nr:hypothetical protein SLEP1_g52055 [Rubroshorea leprosula]
MAATNPACWISSEPSLLGLDGIQPAGSRRNLALLGSGRPSLASKAGSRRNPALLGSGRPSLAGFVETQPDLGLTKPRYGWVSPNPARLGSDEPYWVSSNPTWVPMNPAGSRLTQPCWVYPNLTVGFDETQLGSLLFRC